MVLFTLKYFGNIFLVERKSNWQYQQDNDSKQTSEVAKQFLADEVSETIDWPSNSPDINPIENMCSILKRHVEKRKPSNIDELNQCFT